MRKQTWGKQGKTTPVNYTTPTLRGHSESANPDSSNWPPVSPQTPLETTLIPLPSHPATEADEEAEVDPAGEQS